MFMKMLSIRAKAAFGLVLLTLFILTIGSLNYMALEKMQGNTDLFAARLMPAQGVVLNADRDLYQALVAQQQLLLGGDPQVTAALTKDFAENADQAHERMQSYLKLMSQFPEISSQLDGFEGQYQTWRKQAEQVFALMANGDRDGAMAQHLKQMDSFSALREQYNLAGELDEKLASALRVRSEEVADNSQVWTLSLLSFSVVVGLLLSYFGPKLIVNSILAVHDKVEDISRGEGDLVSRLPITSQDELGKLARSFNRFLDQLQGLIREVGGDVGQLEVSTGTLRQISTQVGDLSENQRMQLSSLVAAFNEINQAVHEISRHAQLTSDQTHMAQASATQGMSLLSRNVEMNQQLAESLKDASDMVTRLADESEKITSVLDVIRSIADQTNLLALNAAIEAARAGDQGRGFAVVADEVRTLASRTQRSTEDIQLMIGSLKQGVQSAVQSMARGSGQMEETLGMADKTRDALSEIQKLVTQVLDMNFQIASATEEQGAVMDEVNRGVSELNSLTEQAGVLAGSVLQTGRDLDGLAQQLSGRVRRFKV
ncbi:MAG: methyl-accepting chemotaxis protein [Aeromonadaceae bacterium]|nr:methyl-accepting chemotaxis protein [Aeromonadaceae bacterium]